MPARRPLIPARRPPTPHWDLPGASFPRALRFFAADYPNAMRLRMRRHGARPPAGWSAGDAAPVVLLPGVYEPWWYLGPIGERLHREGHPVIALPELGRNRLTLDRTADLVTRILRDRDLRGVVLVGHSKGGIVGKLALGRDPDGRIDRLVAIAAPFSGSSMASWMLARPLREFRTAAAAIRALGEDPAIDARITSIYPVFDPHIPEGSRVRGGRNVPLRLAGHFAPILDPTAIEVVAREVAGRV